MFDYEKNLWGRGVASLNWSNPTAFRLKMSLASIPQTGKVLELGCGVGQFIRAIKKIKPALECFGVDISESAIQTAKSLNDGVNYELGGDSIPFVDNFFDAVLIYDVLEHAENPDKIITEVRRILKSGGIFYLFVPCEGDILSVWNFLKKIGVGKNLTKKYAGHINYFTRRDIYNILKRYDFNIISKRFSEHLFGQKIGVLSFFLMDSYARRHSLNQINNEDYYSKVKFGFLKKIINSLIYLESWLFQHVPSPNVHIICQK